MRLLFFLLGCFILFLSCLPCSDSNECTDETAIAIAATDDHEEHNHEEESCTPFCTCSCCAVSLYYAALSRPAEAKLVFRSEKYDLSDVAFNTEAFNSIWQPPRLS